MWWHRSNSLPYVEVGGIILNLRALAVTLRLFLVKAYGRSIDWPKLAYAVVPEKQTSYGSQNLASDRVEKRTALVTT